MKQGELCRRDSDCETGLMCAEMPGRETKSCQPPTTSNKLYSTLTSVYILLFQNIKRRFYKIKRFYHANVIYLQMKSALCQASVTSAADSAANCKGDTGKLLEK